MGNGFQKICVIHLNQIGDLVFSLPLLKALKDNFPQASVHSVVRPYLQELLESVSWVDRILLRPRPLSQKLSLLQTIRRNRYDLLIALPRSEECLIMTALSRARVKAGFAHFPWDVSLDIKETIEGHNGWHNNAKLLKQLNLSVAKNDYVGLLAIEADTAGLDLPADYAVISPGASRRRLAKTWDQEKFIEVMVGLHKKYNLTPVLVGGKDNEAAHKIIQHSVDNRNIPVLNLTGKISLRVLCAVIRKAALFVGIDSGVMHLAACMDIPVVALYGPTDPFYVGPHNRKSIVVREDSLACVPCYLKDCDHLDCMRTLSAEKVLHACDELLTCRPVMR